MEYADYVIVGIIAISILVGVFRGFVKEAFSLAVWIAAFLVAFQYSGVLALQLESHIELPSARTALAFTGLFLAVLLVGGLLTFLVGKLVEKTGLSGSDRLLGGVFGGVRGLILAGPYAGCRLDPGPAGPMVATVTNHTEPDATCRMVIRFFA
jgi:membrane protein required for colicin V production